MEVSYYFEFFGTLEESISVRDVIIGLSSFVIVWFIVGLYYLRNANEVC